MGYARKHSVLTEIIDLIGDAFATAAGARPVPVRVRRRRGGR